ncbi:MAG: toll/interleukin-1 receptor domain-containing protein [Pseudomonadota bacterium]
MEKVIGIVPGAGRASRIGGFFKELTPINVNETDSSRFVVVSEQIIEAIRQAGASPIYFVLNSEKGFISDYFNKSDLFSSDNLFFSFQSSLDQYYGMPFAIDKVFEETKGKTVLLGMPDTIIEPHDAFQILLRNFDSNKSDLELGIFKTQKGSYGGYVEFDSKTHLVKSHVDKTSKNFPFESADNAWAIACWNDRFTNFLHEYVESSRDSYKYTGFGEFRELLFGDIIDAAINSPNLRVCADYISNDSGYYLDVTEPSKYFDAVLHYHSTSKNSKSGKSENSQRRRRENKQIFISHSSFQKDKADDLHFMLKQAGYAPVLDSYDIHGGQQISKRIEALINESRFFVILLSNESLSSKWVQAEIALAYAAGIVDGERILPVQIEDIEESEANKVLFIPRNTYNWLDGRNGMRDVVQWLEKQFK